jgi:hypothetical protein
VVKVLHGADYDVTTLKRDFGFTFANLFDTMIASRVLGRPEIGLQALLRTEFGIALAKDSQKDDWSRRPLTPTQEAYALADVAHLIPLHDRLVAALQELGRLEWVREECAAVAALEPARRGRDAEAWQKVKGARRLSRRQQAVLQAVFAWRDAIADRTDVPASKIVSSATLMELAERHPATVEELRAMKGLSPRVHREAGALLETIARAWALPEDSWPHMPVAPRPVVSDATRRRIEALRTWRTAEASAGPRRVRRPAPAPARAAECGPRSRWTSKPSKACAAGGATRSAKRSCACPPRSEITVARGSAGQAPQEILRCAARPRPSRTPRPRSGGPLLRAAQVASASRRRSASANSSSRGRRGRPRCARTAPRAPCRRS